MKYQNPTIGVISDGKYRHFGGLGPEETGGQVVTVDLCFRLATNGVIVNTKVNDEPLITTGAGTF